MHDHIDLIQINCKAILFFNSFFYAHIAPAMTNISVESKANLSLFSPKPSLVLAEPIGVRADGFASLKALSTTKQPNAYFWWDKSLERTHTNTAFIQFYMVMVPPQRPTGATFLLLLLLDRWEDRETPFTTNTHTHTHRSFQSPSILTPSNQPERRFAFIWLTREDHHDYL